MAAYDLLRVLNGKQKRLPSNSSTVDFLSIKVGASALEIKETSGHFDLSNKKLTNVAQAAASGEAVVLGAGNKIPSSLLPALAITDVFVVADITARDALTIGTGDGEVQEGDVAIVQADSNFAGARHSYIYDGSAWQSLQDGAGVTSVNGQTGDVVLTTDDVDEGTTNFYYTEARFDASLGGKTTDDLAEGTTNLYWTNARFDSAFATKDTDSLGEGASNLYFTETRARDAVWADLAGTWTNKEGGAITVRQVVYQTAAGQVQLAQANDTLAPHTVFRMVRTASIANDSNGGEFWKRGAKVGGFTGLTVGSPIYLSRSSAGGFVQDLTGFVAGEHVVSLGRVLSTTEIEFDPEYLFEY